MKMNETPQKSSSGEEGIVRPENSKNRPRCLECTKKCLLKIIPILDWLPKYKWKDNVLHDILAGLSLACISVPQGLAFAVIANVDLIYGLNSACFSTFIYTLFGTATFSSFGPVSIASMLIGEAVSQSNYEELGFTKSEYIATLTVSVGLCYLIGYILRLGVLTTVLKKPFISGYLSACLSTVFIKYVKLIFGLTLPSYVGYFSLYRNLLTLFSNLPNTNIPTLIISIVILTIFLLNKFYLSPFIKKRCSFVLPIELILITVLILLSYHFDFPSMGVPVVGEVPSGLPLLIFPSPSLFLTVLPQALPIAIINYASTSSMTMLFNRNVDHAQDMFAMAVANLICGNIQCITIGNSLMRTVIAAEIGLKSLLSSTFSSFFLFFIILFVGPLFAPLPTAILGCVILMAAAKLFIRRIMDVKTFYKCYEDLFIFFATFLSTLAIDLVVGLIIGGLLSLRKILHAIYFSERRKTTLEEKKSIDEVQPNEESNLEYICHL